MAIEVKSDTVNVSVTDLVGAIKSATSPAKLGVPIQGKVATMPNAVKPGYAVICNNKMQEHKLVEVYMVCAPGRGAEVFPIEGRLRGPVLAGSLIDGVMGGQVCVAQYAHYPARRDDGKAHVVGGIAYPDPSFYIEFNGVFYHTAYGAKFLDAAMAEAPKK